MGAGVAQDNQQALNWYLLAADQHDVDAQYNLGNMYNEGRGVERNRKEAFYWFRLSALQGDIEAKQALKELLRAK